MDWNTGNNPWAPGGKMTVGLPWAQQGLQGMQHGWQQAGGYFAPKSQAQIQREALLQLAILAAVVAAPALLGAGGGAAGGAASTSTAATAATKTAATTSMVESATIIAPTAPIVTTGTAATVTGASAASGLGAAALMPFIGAAALQNLLGAAMGGPQVLNQALQQQAPATRPSFVFDPGQAAPQLDKDGRHPAMPMLEEMAGKIGKDRMLELSLRRALATGNLTGLAGQPAVMGLVAQAVRAIPPGNPWAGGSNAQFSSAIPKFFNGFSQLFTLPTAGELYERFRPSMLQFMRTYVRSVFETINEENLGIIGANSQTIELVQQNMVGLKGIIPQAVLDAQDRNEYALELIEVFTGITEYNNQGEILSITAQSIPVDSFTGADFPSTSPGRGFTWFYVTYDQSQSLPETLADNLTKTTEQFYTLTTSTGGYIEVSVRFKLQIIFNQ